MNRNYRNYRVKEYFDINHYDPNPKVKYRLEKKVLWWWKDVWPSWPACDSKDELLERYYRCT
jgi:hypothetical protein